MALVDRPLGSPSEPVFCEPASYYHRSTRRCDLKYLSKSSKASSPSSTSSSSSSSSSSFRDCPREGSTMSHRKNPAYTEVGFEASSELLIGRQALSKSAELAMTLLQRYHQAVSTKLYDVEELIDFYFHRRFAAVAAVCISYLPIVITPNQITLFGMVIGWAAAVCLYDSEFHEPLGWEPSSSLSMAAFLIFFWIVSDCTDGQVARLCNRGTRTGRILDGIVDGLVIAPNCFVLGLVTGNRYGHSTYFFTFFASFSLWLHALIYDRVKNVYLKNVLAQSECDNETIDSVREEYVESKRKDPYSLDSILLGIYVVYLKLQVQFTSSEDIAKEELLKAQRSKKLDAESRTLYQKEYYNLVRLASFMGISAHVSGLYVAYYAAIYYWEALWWVQVYFAVVLNAILLVVLAFCAKTQMKPPVY